MLARASTLPYPRPPTVNRGDPAAAPRADSQSVNIPAGRGRVVDVTYTINGKLPAWPGDNRTFEAHVVATPQKDGYFARSF